MELNGLQQEWRVLQSANDNFESLSLLIKLVAVALLFIGVINGVYGLPVALILSCLWLQDAIWKTFQSRHEVRLIEIEQAIINGEADKAFQFNVTFTKSRPGTFGLIKAYLTNALRPTVAFPHIVLIMLSFALPLM
ncbi:hypothetical protein [Thalassotalea marina]|uniref:Uncharacterized protein n=1 Tax=Thalassotalea marina TaxID=1673741 RepID=A0A919EK89_9GAMM|nr:hypothetical protein [Thalassotalea marina]GHF91626.1 hypothetical protein GCM10017161_19380 [Thalassotalea marina]